MVLIILDVILVVLGGGSGGPGGGGGGEDPYKAPTRLITVFYSPFQPCREELKRGAEASYAFPYKVPTTSY